MLKKSIYIALVFIGLLFFVAIGEVFADTSAQFEQAKSNIISLIQQGNFAEAEVQTQKLLANSSEQKGIAEAVWQIGQKYIELNKYDKSFEIHQYNVGHFPSDMYAMWSQVEIVYSFIRDGNEPAADAAFDKLLTVFSGQPTLPKEVYQIAKGYDELKKYDKALEIHQYNLEHFPGNIYAMWSQVYSHIRDANELAADAAFNKLAAVFSNEPTLPEEIWRVAKKYEQLQKYDNALQIHQYNVEHFPKDIYAMWSQVEITYYHIRNSNDAAADAAYDKLLTVFSQQPTLPKEVYQIADAYSNAGKYDKADRLYQYVIENRPADENIYAPMSAVMAYIGLGDEANALAVLDKLISDFKDHPDLPTAIFATGEEYYNKAFRGENQGLNEQSKEYYRKALTVWERVIQKLPPSAAYTPRAYYSVAVCRCDLGEYEEAINYCRKVVDNWPDCERASHAQFQIALCYEKLERSGRIATADAAVQIRQACEKLLTNYPSCQMTKGAYKLLKRYEVSKQ